jgi:hypothetical protein
MKRNKPAEDSIISGEETRVITDREVAVLFSHEWHIPLWDSPCLEDYKDLSKFLTRARHRNAKTYTKWATDELNRSADLIITLLAIKAKNGDAEAAQLLARLAKKTTEFLNEVCGAKPELVRPLARRVRDWPVIKRKVRNLSDDEKQLFRTIQLSADDFVENDAQAARWRFDDAGRIAYSLIVFIRNARNCAADSMINRGSGGTISRGKIILGLVPWYRRGARSRIRQMAKQKLKTDFNKESWVEWWKFAEEFVLLRTYPKVLEIPELDSLAPRMNKKRNKPLCPSTRKQKILSEIKSRFKSFARNFSYD